MRAWFLVGVVFVAGCIVEGADRAPAPLVVLPDAGMLPEVRNTPDAGNTPEAAPVYAIDAAPEHTTPTPDAAPPAPEAGPAPTPEADAAPAAYCACQVLHEPGRMYFDNHPCGEPFPHSVRRTSNGMACERYDAACYGACSVDGKSGLLGTVSTPTST